MKGKDVVKKIFEPKWFINQNFHGQWYTDADDLENYLHFRDNMPVKDYFKHLSSQVPFFYKLSGIAPLSLVKKFMMKPIAYSPMFGTQTWIENGMKERITAFYGSMDKYNAIGDWDEFEVVIPDK